MSGKKPQTPKDLLDATRAIRESLLTISNVDILFQGLISQQDFQRIIQGPSVLGVTFSVKGKPLNLHLTLQEILVNPSWRASSEKRVLLSKTSPTKPRSKNTKRK